MNDLIRVFFHELGHFIANEINNRYYNSSSTYAINLKPLPLAPFLYDGDTKINEGKNLVDGIAPTIERLPEVLASLVYGCIFQSARLNTSLLICLNMHGGNDVGARNLALFENGLDHLQIKISEVEDEYFEILSSGEMLNEIINIAPDNYLIRNADGSYNIDVTKLRNDTNEFIDQHYETYKILIEKYKEVFSHKDDDLDRKF